MRPEDRAPSNEWIRVDSADPPISFEAPENMRPGPFGSMLGIPRGRDGDDVQAAGWVVHALKTFPEPRYALKVGIWWLEPLRFGVTADEIADLSASLSQSGKALDFMSRHFGGRNFEFADAHDRELTPTADLVGRRIRIFTGDEYVVVPVRERGVLVVGAHIAPDAEFERRHVWPRILGSVQIGIGAGDERQVPSGQPRRVVDDPRLPAVFAAPEELHATSWFASALGTPRTASGGKSQPRSWELRSPEFSAIPSLAATRTSLEIAFFWQAAEGEEISEAEVEDLTGRMSRNGLGLEFLRRHFDGEPAEFRRARELNLVPIGSRLGQRIAIYDRAEYVVLPVRGQGVLVAAANFADGRGYEQYRIWPRIVASIRMRDDAPLEPAD